MKWLLLIGVCTALLFIPIALLSQFTLDSMEKKVEKDHPVPNMSVTTLRDTLDKGATDHFLLFDTRKPEEYDRSHLNGAIRISPDIDADGFLETYGAYIKGKTMVFYCSVGKRSSIIAEKLLNSSVADSAMDIYNLRGGIFRWYNTGYPVYDAQGQTPAVHPYNRFWGQLIDKGAGGGKKP